MSEKTETSALNSADQPVPEFASPDLFTERRSLSDSSAATPPLCRDPRDIVLHKYLLFIILGQALINAFLFAALLYKYYEKPDLIAVTTDVDGRIVTKLNNRIVPTAPIVRIGKDNFTDADKKAVVESFCEALYLINPVPAVRALDIKRGVKLMTDSAGEKYFEWLKSSGQLQIEQNERWQSTWTVQSSQVDARDPHTWHLIGTQEITKNSGTERPATEKIQWQLTFKLAFDNTRTSRNLNTGYLISNFEGNKLSNSSE